MNETYTRKPGFFGSVKTLGTTTVTGANDIVTNAVTTTVKVTNVAVTTATVLDEGVATWGQTMLRTIESNARITDMELQIEEAQMTHELEGLQARLAEVKATPVTTKRPVGRPKAK